MSFSLQVPGVCHWWTLVDLTHRPWQHGEGPEVQREAERSQSPPTGSPLPQQRFSN